MSQGRTWLRVTHRSALATLHYTSYMCTCACTLISIYPRRSPHTVANTAVTREHPLLQATRQRPHAATTTTSPRVYDLCGFRLRFDLCACGARDVQVVAYRS